MLKTSKIGIRIESCSLSGPRHFVRTEHFRTCVSMEEHGVNGTHLLEDRGASRADKGLAGAASCQTLTARASGDEVRLALCACRETQISLFTRLKP